MIVYLIASWCYPDVDQALVLMLTREGWFLLDVLGCLGFLWYVPISVEQSKMAAR